MNFDYIKISSRTWKITKEPYFKIDITKYSFFNPIGLTFLAGLIKKQFNYSDAGSIAFNTTTINYLERINFLEWLDKTFSDKLTIYPNRPNIYRSTLEDRLLEFDEIKFKNRYDYEECITHMSELCQERVGDSIEFMYIDDVFAELLSNIAIHSHTLSFFVVAQKYPSNNTIKISISDLGVGIPYNIRRFYPNIVTDNDSIIYATEPEISSAGGGMGLTTLKSYLEDPADYLFIASNKGCVKFTKKSTISYSGFDSNFTGTFIEICFRSHSKYRQAIQDIEVLF